MIFKQAKWRLLFIPIVPCDPVYDHAIENIRNNLWNVELHAGIDGELFYTISTNTKNTAVKG